MSFFLFSSPQRCWGKRRIQKNQNQLCFVLCWSLSPLTLYFSCYCLLQSYSQDTHASRGMSAPARRKSLVFFFFFFFFYKVLLSCCFLFYLFLFIKSQTLILFFFYFSFMTPFFPLILYSISSLFCIFFILS